MLLEDHILYFCEGRGFDILRVWIGSVGEFISVVGMKTAVLLMEVLVQMLYYKDCDNSGNCRPRLH